MTSEPEQPAGNLLTRIRRYYSESKVRVGHAANCGWKLQWPLHLLLLSASFLLGIKRRIELLSTWSIIFTSFSFPPLFPHFLSSYLKTPQLVCHHNEA